MTISLLALDDNRQGFITQYGGLNITVYTRDIPQIRANFPPVGKVDQSGIIAPGEDFRDTFTAFLNRCVTVYTSWLNTVGSNYVRVDFFLASVPQGFFEYFALPNRSDLKHQILAFADFSFDELVVTNTGTSDLEGGFFVGDGLLVPNIFPNGSSSMIVTVDDQSWKNYIKIMNEGYDLANSSPLFPLRRVGDAIDRMVGQDLP